MGRRGNAYGNGLDLDGDGGGVADFCRMERHHGRRGRGGSGGGRGGGAAVHRHGRGAVPVERSHGDHVPLRLSGKLAALLRPALRRLLPRASRDPETLAAVSANVSANLLGLGNAATPLGIRAARRMARGTDGTADDELCRLVVLNTASLQLLPTTVAGVRAACGCRTPFDILPAVWLSSAISVTAGLLAARLLQRVWRD